MLSKFIIALLVFSFMYSCSSIKKTKHNNFIKHKKNIELIKVLENESNKNIDFFYSKFSTKVKSPDLNISFKTTVKMKRDSAINVVMSFLNIPVFIANISKDSVKIINKKEKCYTYENFKKISDLIGMELKLKNIEEIFLGIPLYFDASKKHYQIKDDKNYIISSHKEKEYINPTSNSLMLKYYLSKDSMTYHKVFIFSPKKQESLLIEMKKFEYLNDEKIPSILKITAKNNKGTVNINLKYYKTMINVPKPIYFKVPKQYKQCE